MKRKYIIICVFFLIFLLSPFFQFIKSLLVMSVYSAYENSYSVQKENHIKLDIPGGLSTSKKDWYPFVMTYNTSEDFSDYIGREVKVSILYNFGAFDYLKGSSLFYNPKSDYYGAFYGAYVVQGQNKPFGFTPEEEPIYQEMFLVPEYDMKVLVLESLGCENPVFKLDKMMEVPQQDLLDYRDWEVVTGSIVTQSPAHHFVDNKMAYTQYGKPLKLEASSPSFPTVTMEAKVYAKYFEEQKVSIFFYIIAPNDAVIKDWEKDILLKTKLKFN